MLNNLMKKSSLGCKNDHKCFAKVNYIELYDDHEVYKNRNIILFFLPHQVLFFNFFFFIHSLTFTSNSSLLLLKFNFLFRLSIGTSKLKKKQLYNF